MTATVTTTRQLRRKAEQPLKKRKKKLIAKVSKRKPSKKVLAFIDHQLNRSGRGAEFVEQARQQLRLMCKRDLWFLCYHVLGYTDLDSELHHEMCHIWKRREHRRLTLWLIPRGHCKTTVWTIGDAIQQKLIDPNNRHLIVNAKLENAESILGEIRGHFENSEMLRWLFPEYCWDKMSQSQKKKFENSGGKLTVGRLDFPCRTVWRKEGNIEIMSVGASLVSKHFDRMTYDDMINDKFVESADVRAGVHKWYRNSLQLRNDPETPIRIIGTRWHFDDVYGRLIRAEDDFRKRMAKKGKTKARLLKYVRTATERDKITGKKGPIWPERFKMRHLREIKEDIGSYIYSCQYENNPLPDESAIFKANQIKDIPIYDVPRRVNHFIGVDLADEDTKKGDYSAISVIAVDQFGKTYVKECIRAKMFTLELVHTVMELVEKYDPQRVAVETTAFQKSIYKYWKQVSTEKGVYVPWAEVKRSGQRSKFRRILMLQPVVERGDFYIVEDAIGRDWLRMEMTEFSGKDSAYDDLLDATQSAYEISFLHDDPIEVSVPSDCVMAIFNRHFGEVAFDEDDEDDFDYYREPLFGNAA